MISVLKSTKIPTGLIDIAINKDYLLAVDSKYNLYYFDKKTLSMFKSLNVVSKYEPIHSFSKAFAISKDGMINLSLSMNKNDLLLGHTDEKLKKRAILPNHEQEVESSQFSDNCKLLATGGQDGRVFVYDLEHLKVITSLDIQSDYIGNIVFSKDSSLMLTSCFNKANIIFDIDRNIKIRTVMTKDVAEDAKFFDSNRQLYMVTRGGQSVVYDVKHRKTVSTENLFTHWPTVVEMTPDDKYAIVGTRSSMIYAVRLEDNKIMFNASLESTGVTSIKFHGKNIIFGFSDGSLKMVDYCNNTEELEVQIKIKNFQKAKDMFNANKFLTLTPLIDKFNDGWDGVLKRVIDLISKNEVDAAIKISKPFVDDPEKAEELNFYLSQKEQVGKLIELIEQKDFVSAFTLVEKYAYLKELSLYSKLEIFWQKTFSKAKAMLEENAVFNKAKVTNLLKPFQRIKSKDQIIRNLLTNTDKFTQADETVKRQEFATYFAMVAKFEFLADTELHKKVLRLGERLHQQVLAMIQNSKFEDAKKVLEKLSMFKPYKLEVEKLSKEVMYNMDFQKAIMNNNVTQAYVVAENYPDIKLLPAFQKLDKEFKDKVESCKQSAYSGKAAKVLEALDAYTDIDYTLDKVASLMKIAYLKEMEISGGGNMYSWQATIDNYLEMFNYDIQLKQTLEKIDKADYVEDMEEEGLITEPGYRTVGLQKTILKEAKNI
jgi:WD40 repeat protein